MSAASIKFEIIEWLMKLEDKQVLDSLARLKKSFQSEDWYAELSTAQKKSLEKGIQDHKKGKYLSSKEFWSRYEKAT